MWPIFVLYIYIYNTVTFICFNDVSFLLDYSFIYIYIYIYIYIILLVLSLYYIKPQKWFFSYPESNSQTIDQYLDKS